MHNWSWCSLVSVVIRWWVGWTGFISWWKQGMDYFLFITTCRPVPGPTQPLMQWIPGVKWLTGIWFLENARIFLFAIASMMAVGPIQVYLLGEDWGSFLWEKSARVSRYRMSRNLLLHHSPPPMYVFIVWCLGTGTNYLYLRCILCSFFKQTLKGTKVKTWEALFG
jgi:hypothetical protein